MNCNEMLNCIIESEDQGILFLNRKGIISQINEKAKEIIGISFQSQMNHRQGNIEKGDIVIIADTELGEDDGDLRPDDLKVIGITDNKIKTGSCFIGIGAYKEPQIKAKYKVSNSDLENKAFEMQENFCSHDIIAAIDFAKNEVRISVDGQDFNDEFVVSYGHMVVLDGKTGKMKFFQRRGYTVRKEGIKQILSGMTYMAKDSSDSVDIIGKEIHDVFGDGAYLDELREILDSNSDVEFKRNQVIDLNKRPLLSSIYPVKDENGQTSGVLIKITEFANLQTELENRNDRIFKIEEKKKEIYSNKRNTSIDTLDNLIGNSSEIRAVKNLAYKIATRNCNVLITGESGTGKSMLAKEIYNVSNEDGPFVAVDCSTIPPTLFESEMFGYTKGAFTGADPKGKKGFFESADGGVIFLDEIGEIPNEIQAKLLNVIQNREIYRIGSTVPTPVSVKIIAATNKNLEEEVKQGRFRLDLYYRINVFSIEIPPLRKRKEDIYYFTQYFIDLACEKYDIEKKVLSNEALMKILVYDWPGNVRELQNIIERATLISDDDIIYAEDIHIAIVPTVKTLKESLQLEEKRFIEESLHRNQNDKKKTMQELGVSKSVFYAKLKEYNIKY